MIGIQDIGSTEARVCGGGMGHIFSETYSSEHSGTLCW